jgi:hypothetical protein
MFGEKIKTKLIPISDPAARTQFVKKALLIFLNLFLSLVVAGLLLRLTNPLNGYHRLDQLLMLGAALLWLCVYLISGTVFSFSLVLILSFICFVVILLPFLRHLDPVIFGVFFLLALLWGLSARYSARQAVGNSIKLRPAQIVAVSKGKLILILSLLISLSLWSVKFGTVNAIDKFNFSDILSSLYPGYDEQKTVGELVDSIADKQVSGVLNKVLPSGLSPLQTELTKQGIKEEAKDSILAQISSLLDRKVSPKEKISEVLHSFVDFYYKSLPQTTRRIIDFVILLVIFAFWLGIFQLLSFVFYIVFWLILEILLFLRIIKVGLITVEKETLII